MKAVRWMIAIGILGIAISAFAQYPYDPYGRVGGTVGMGPEQPQAKPQPPNVDYDLKKLTKELNLTDGQQRQVRSTLEDEQDRLQQLNDEFLPRQARRAKLTEIHETTSKGIREVLNDDQQAKFTDFEKKHKKDWQ